MQWFHILFTAIITEGLIAYVKMVIKDKKIHPEVIASALIGIGVAVSYRIDLFAALDIYSSVPYIGCILTGILISRGSNYIHDLFKMIMDAKVGMSELFERPKNEINIDVVNHEV